MPGNFGKSNAQKVPTHISSPGVAMVVDLCCPGQQRGIPLELGAMGKNHTVKSGPLQIPVI
jgi:hypothetical protein